METDNLLNYLALKFNGNLLTYMGIKYSNIKNLFANYIKFSIIRKYVLQNDQ